MNDITSSRMPSMINAAILPPSEIFLISNKNNLSNATVKILNAIIRKVLFLYLIPSQMLTNENTAQVIVSPAFEKLDV